MKTVLHKKITKTFVVFCLLLNLFAKWQSRSVKLSRLAKNTRHAKWGEILFEVAFLFRTSLACVLARYSFDLITFTVHKVHSFLKQCSVVHDFQLIQNKVLQLMSAEDSAFTVLKTIGLYEVCNKKFLIEI